MNRFNAHSFLFAILLLAAVIIGKNFYSPSPNTLDASPEMNSGLEDASLSATANISVLNIPPLEVVLYTAPDIKASAALAKALNEPVNFFEINSNQVWPIASLTKLMTATIALEKIDADQKIVVSENAVATEGVAGNLQAGKSYTIDDLINALMGVSSNDAATAIAERYGHQKFITKMNLRARELGMKNTNFADPTGLSPLNQSTVGDLEKLVSYIFEKHPAIFAASRQKEIRIGDAAAVPNINPFAGRTNFIGGKTGYTDEANGNLISLFDYDGQPILIIVLGSDDRFKETQKIYDYLTSSQTY